MSYEVTNLSTILVELGKPAALAFKLRLESCNAIIHLIKVSKEAKR